MNNPFFSIIIPIYKVENYLRQCVDSVLAQDFTDIEVILVDDGSPDRCPVICDEYAAKDERVKVLHKPNGGLSDARNKGLDLSTGTYVLFLDSDDYYNNTHFLTALKQELEANDYEMLCFQRQIMIDDDVNNITPLRPYSDVEVGEKDVYRLIESLSKHDCLDSSACMKALKRTFLVDNKLYFRKGIFSEDIEWFMRLLSVVKRFSVTNLLAHVYRIRSSSISHNVNIKNINDVFLSIELHANSYRNSDIELLKKGVLNYLLYQYFIVLGYTSKVLNGTEQRNMYERCGQFFWLCDYAISKKTFWGAQLYKILGMKTAAWLFGKYISWHR